MESIKGPPRPEGRSRRGHAWPVSSQATTPNPEAPAGARVRADGRVRKRLWSAHRPYLRSPEAGPGMASAVWATEPSPAPPPHLAPKNGKPFAKKMGRAIIWSCPSNIAVRRADFPRSCGLRPAFSGSRSGRAGRGRPGKPLLGRQNPLRVWRECSDTTDHFTPRGRGAAMRSSSTSKVRCQPRRYRGWECCLLRWTLVPVNTARCRRRSPGGN
jgi:hypothetical protein